LSLGLDMLQTAARATDQLAGRSRSIGRFVRGCLNDDGGYRGRSSDSDLYFTVFAVSCLKALGSPVPGQTVEYLRSFAGGHELDLVHLACLARCWSLVRENPAASVADEIRSRIEAHRCPDGGYSQTPHADTGTAYGCFLAVGAYQDLAVPVSDRGQITRCLQSLRNRDGGYGNLPGSESSSVPATAAAVVTLAQLQRGADAFAGNWLVEQCLPSGGFRAAVEVPVPDLLSTATALLALKTLSRDLSAMKKRCLNFVESLWDARGGFRAHEFDDHLDCENTFYGLLAMGVLASKP